MKFRDILFSRILLLYLGWLFQVGIFLCSPLPLKANFPGKESQSAENILGCSVISLTTTASLFDQSKEYFQSVYGMGWIYRSADQRKLFVIAPNHVVDLGTNTRLRSISGACGEKVYQLKVRGSSVILDLAVLEFVQSDSRSLPRPLLQFDGPRGQWSHGDQIYKLSNFRNLTSYQWSRDSQSFKGQLRLLENPFRPSLFPIFSPYSLYFKDFTPRALEEFPQYKSIFVYPLFGAPYGTSGSLVFEDSDLAKPAGMILRTFIGENATLILPLDEIARHLNALEKGKDPAVEQFPQLSVSLQAHRSLLGFEISKRVRIHFKDREFVFDEISGQNSWATVGGSWGDVGSVSNQVGAKLKNQRDRWEDWQQKVVDPSHRRENERIYLENQSAWEPIVAFLDFRSSDYFYKINSIDRVIWYVSQFPSVLKSSSALESVLVRNSKSLEPYDFVCGNPGLGFEKSLYGELKLTNSDFFKKMPGNKIAVDRRERLMFKASNGSNDSSPVQFFCLPKTRSLVIFNLDKKEHPLLVFIVTGSRVQGIFNFKQDELNNDERFQYPSTDPGEVLKKLLSEIDYEYAMDTSVKGLWNLETSETRNYHFRLVFDSFIPGYTPFLTIIFDKIPDDQRKDAGFSIQEEGDLSLSGFESQWFLEGRQPWTQ